MGTAMAGGWLAKGLPPHGLTMVDPSPAQPVIEFARKHSVQIADTVPQEPARVVVLAVKPQVMGDVMGDAAMAVGPDTLVVSIAAGIPMAKLSKGTGTHRVVRVMPNTPAQIGKGISGAYAGDISSEDKDVATALLEAAGRVVWVENETDIDAVTSVSGSGPAYVFHLVEALAAAGEAEGLPAETAMALARQTIVGAAGLLEEDDEIPASKLRENVTSPKGTTAAALDVLMADEDGLRDLIRRAVHAARLRAEELGQ